MGIGATPEVIVGDRRISLFGIAATLALVALSAGGLAVSVSWKLLVVSWVAFVAMAGFAALGVRETAAEATRARRRREAARLVWGYGLASGAMVTSAAVFLLPQAFGPHPPAGGFGVAAGVLVGYGGHTVGHRLAHLGGPFDSTVAQLSAHALTAGLIIGTVYASLPDLGLLLGLAIISHKGPAGYAAARRLSRAGRPASVLLVPAAGVGLTALPVALLGPSWSGAVSAAVFGFAAGIFLHVAMDFLPTERVLHNASGDEGIMSNPMGDVATEADDHSLDLQAVGSTLLGGTAVLVAWLLVAA